MFSSTPGIKNSIARYFIGINKLDLLNKFIKLLIQAKNNKDNSENVQYINELISALSKAFISKDAQETYTNGWPFIFNSFVTFGNR